MAEKHLAASVSVAGIVHDWLVVTPLWDTEMQQNHIECE